MNRSKLDEHKAWKKYKVWQKENLDKIRPGQEISSLGEFQEIYNNLGRRISKIKEEVQFQSSQETFRAFAKQYKSYTKKSLSLKARRELSTQDLAGLLIDEINDYREEQIKMLKDDGFSDKEAKREAAMAISAYFFGS